MNKECCGRTSPVSAVAESLREHGQNPKLFTGILQKAIGYLRGFVEFLRETKYCDRDPEGNSLIDHDVWIDITPEPFPAKPKGKRPSSEKLDLLTMQYGYKNALEITKAMKTARPELKKVQMAQKAWDSPETKQEKLYLTILANVQNVEKREVQKETGQRQSIHERLEEKKQIVEQRPKKRRSRDVGER